MVLYCLGRWVLRPHHIGGWMVHDYLNDLLCLPLFLPVILGLQARLGIRRHHRPPTMLEILHNWLIFSIVFELVLPRLSLFNSVADPWDCVAYLAGGIAAWLVWKWKARSWPRCRGIGFSANRVGWRRGALRI